MEGTMTDATVASLYVDELAALRTRIARLEAENACRHVMAEYMRLCDELGADTPMDDLGELFAADAIWEGRGARYSAAFGGHRGRRAIVDFLDTYRRPQPHFALNVHYLASEAIRVHGDTQARGSWAMLQLSTLSRGESIALGARLEVEFRFVDGRWRIARFVTRNLFSQANVRAWNDDTAVPVPDAG